MKEKEIKALLVRMLYKTASKVETSEELIDFIFNNVLRVSGKETRGWNISPSFMYLMAEHGQDIIEIDKYKGEILMEMALQRLTVGAVLHEPVNLVDILPDDYKKYTAHNDEADLINKDAWYFIEKQLFYCITKLENFAYRDHAQKILFGLLKYLNADGTTEAGYMWPETFSVSAREAWEWTIDTAVEIFGLKGVIEKIDINQAGYYKDILLSNKDLIDWPKVETNLDPTQWKQNLWFLTEFAGYFDLKGFIKKIDIEKETYYEGKRRKRLKALGLYGILTRNKIKKEFAKARKLY